MKNYKLRFNYLSRQWFTGFRYGGDSDIVEIFSTPHEHDARILSEKGLNALSYFMSIDNYEIVEYTGPIVY